VYAAACLPPGDIFRLLKPGEADQLALADGAKDFLVKGPGVDVHGIQVRIAAPLLEDFLRTASERLADGKPGADLRFAHAETIAPIAALMGIEGAATPDTDLAHYTDVWQADRVMVFSGNIQWVFFRKPGADDLVEVLFNERPVHIPVPAASFPFYRWVDVKKYYSALLKA
jgi:multiple inositol-polyphosphate phosphatase / 2,3-bisphosphoglycerate 3-phosphatase